MEFLYKIFDDEYDLWAWVDGVLTWAAKKITHIWSPEDTTEKPDNLHTRWVIGRIRGSVGSILKSPFRHSAWFSQKRRERGSVFNPKNFLAFNSQCERALDAKRKMKKLDSNQQKQIENSPAYKGIKEIYKNIAKWSVLGVAEIAIPWVGEAMDDGSTLYKIGTKLLEKDVGDIFGKDFFDFAPHVGEVEEFIHNFIIDKATGNLYPARIMITLSEFRRAYPDLIRYWNDIGDQIVSLTSGTSSVVPFPSSNSGSQSDTLAA